MANPLLSEYTPGAPVSLAQTDPMQAAQNQAANAALATPADLAASYSPPPQQVTPPAPSASMGIPQLASSGYDPIANAEANPNGAITAQNNPGAFNSLGQPIQAPPVAAVIPASQTKDAAGNVVSTKPAQAVLGAGPGRAAPSPADLASATNAGLPLSPDDARARVLAATQARSDAATGSNQPIPYGASKQGAGTGAPGAGAAGGTTSPGSLMSAYGARGGGGALAGAYDPFKHQNMALAGQRSDLESIDKDRALAAKRTQIALEDATDATGNRGTEIAADRARHQKELDEAAAKRDAIIDHEANRDYRKEEYERGGPLGHIADFLATVAGGFYQGWNHMAENPALKQIEARTAAYVQDQQQQSALKIKKGESLYDRIKEKVGSDDEAKALTYATVLEKTKLELQSAASKTDDVEKRAYMAKAADDLTLQIAKNRDDAIALARRQAAASQPTIKATLEAEDKLADIRRKNAETAKLEAEARGGGKEERKEAEAERKAAEASDRKEHVPESLATAKDLQHKISANGGELPGTDIGGRIARSAAESGIPGISALGNVAISPEEQAAHAQLEQLAANTLPDNERGSPKSIQARVEQLYGNGSPEKVAAGVKEAQRIIASRASSPETLANSYTRPQRTAAEIGFRPVGQ
jgi:hypothetical protein